MSNRIPRVLVVDDDKAVLRAYQRILSPKRDEEATLELTLLERSEEAASLVRRAEQEHRNYAVAFVDYDFPSGPNGVALARILLSLDDHLEIVLCTSLAEQLESEVKATIGPTARLFVLKKPFVPIEIRQLTNALIEKWKLRRATEGQIEALQELDRIKDELLSTVNHELRTPLTSLRGFAELMLMREFPREKQRELLGVILEESLRLERLVTDLLDLQRAGRGGLDYHFQRDLDLMSVVMEAARPFAIDAAGNERVRIEAPATPSMVRADPQRIHQVIANLLSNAIKFSGQHAEIVVQVRNEGSFALVSVEDNGPGIPAAALPQLFERFYRVDNSATRRVGGSGLGLSLVRAIIEAHGGEVNVESEVGKGSRFWFSLPHAIGEAPTP